MKAKINNFIAAGKQYITFELVGDFREQYDSLKDKLLDITVKEHKEKRSLRANAYSWTLTDKLADVMLVRGVKLSKEEMHAEMIFRYGQSLKDEDGNNVIISSVSNVKVNEFYPYVREIGESELNGKTFKHYRVLKGSHEYNSQEMAVFIKGIVEECKEQGIPTETPEEIARMTEG